MNYLNYLPCDTRNGEGIRCTLFVSGCELACKGCHNPDSWKLNAGKPYTKEFEDKILSDLANPYIKGLSLSGGHPLHPKNFSTVLNLCKKVKQELPDKGIWLWTGLTVEEVRERGLFEILGYIDVLVDGRYVEVLKTSQGEWRGSSNQRVMFITGIT
ncbi:anaerobic ribonucleoside triphosphate reductase activating protein [Vibrio phage helene 12B3]|uniref:anaerobic ribonucleotide reductase small subunit n=1 Tax=Vibrio phage helene 12B3 TaxID=573173 RepID=UPI0002C11D1B|nr:anaerobic ribonucleotide reductase small subunit [Vibrio phage helene 12B3]AGG57795.1 anaerobic ribonucleoside triphosphate reductase activating protein [Vibrio phage helene 12B3]